MAVRMGRLKPEGCGLHGISDWKLWKDEITQSFILAVPVNQESLDQQYTSIGNEGSAI